MSRIRTWGLWACTFVACTIPSPATTGQTALPSPPRDGQHDFDFEFGAWKTHLRRLVHPLSGSTKWVTCDGTTVVRKVWDGRANLVELDVTCPSGRLQALSLRLYSPQSHQWSLNFASRNSGEFSTPTIGAFENGRGEFIDQETLNGRYILVRFVISDITSTSCRFEQSFSDDGGKTWEANWVAEDTRIPEGDQLKLQTEQIATEDKAQHDFDFQFGRWQPRVSRLRHPLSGSTEWLDYEGQAMVQKIFNGAANLVQLTAHAAGDNLEILCLRLYNPETHQWSLNYANSASGTLTPPVWGAFSGGHGEFYGQDQVNSRTVYVRNTISGTTPSSIHFEQAFSDDGGKTWETNFIETLTRVKDESNGTN